MISGAAHSLVTKSRRSGSQPVRLPVRLGTPCRVGCEKAVKLMRNERWDTGLLEDLSSVMAGASICGLGQAAPNPIRSVMKYFAKDIS